MKNSNIIRLSTLSVSFLIASASLSVAAPDFNKQFDRFDKDGNGSISREEMGKTMTAQAKRQGNEQAIANADKRAAGRIKNNDTDGDGALSKDEFMAMAKKAKGPAKVKGEGKAKIKH